VSVVYILHLIFSLFIHYLHVFWKKIRNCLHIYESWQCTCTCTCIFPMWTLVKMCKIVCMCHFVQWLYPHVLAFLKKIEFLYMMFGDSCFVSIWTSIYVVCNVYHYCFMPPPFEEWWRGIKCYPWSCVHPSVRPSKLWCPLNNFWMTASFWFIFGLLIDLYNIKTQVKFDFGYNLLIFGGVMGLL